MKSTTFRLTLIILTVLVLFFLYETGILDQLIRLAISGILGTEDPVRMIEQILG